MSEPSALPQALVILILVGLVLVVILCWCCVRAGDPKGVDNCCRIAWCGCCQQREERARAPAPAPQQQPIFILPQNGGAMPALPPQPPPELEPLQPKQPAVRQSPPPRPRAVWPSKLEG